MHELSLAGGVLRVVEDAAARDGFARVSRLTLEAGALAGVEVRALRFALESLAPGTCLEGAEVVIDEPPAPPGATPAAPRWRSGTGWRTARSAAVPACCPPAAPNCACAT